MTTYVHGKGHSLGNLNGFFIRGAVGTGAESSYPHSMQKVPFIAFAIPRDASAATPIAGTHTRTNFLFNVADGEVFDIMCFMDNYKNS